MTDQYYAHSLKGQPPEKWHKLEDHLLAVAELAKKFAEPFGSGEWAWNAAWLHDVGKADGRFQAYLRRENGLDDLDYDGCGSGRINHSSAGAAYAENQYGPFIGRTLAYLVAGHHAGLPDWDSAVTGRAALSIRYGEGNENLSSIQPFVDTAAKNFLSVSKPPLFVKKESFHFWARMIFSCLVDADYLDTEVFMDQGRSAQRSNFSDIQELRGRFSAHMEKFKTDSAVNKVRREVLKACCRAAQSKTGLFSLTVPTGGGKTLSSMAFALEHALVNKMNRIIYVIPYTSIIEQTANVFAEIFGRENIVEHHSNIDPERETQRLRLASENWDAPIVITTNVQFFESLYAAKSSRCRKLHNLVNSVVILDEAQLLPPKFLDPCLAAIDQLTKNYGASVVFATATQPALPNLEKPTEIIPDPESLYQRLRRTQIQMPSDINLKLESWHALALQLKDYDQVLCVVNSRRDCYELFKLMPEGTIHLSALMCGAHRSRVVEKIKKRLASMQKIRVISTQLVEAGVDIDFPVVYRALAGLDSIIQSAGRCNREGRLNEKGVLGKVIVFTPPRPSPAGLLRKGEDTTKELVMLNDFSPEDPKEYRRYFSYFYSRLSDTGSNFSDWLVKDVPSVQFRTAAQNFNFIDNQAQQTIFVRFGDNDSLLNELRIAGPKREIMRKLQRYTVNLSAQLFEKYRSSTEELCPGIFLWIGRYDDVTGVDVFAERLPPEELIV